MYLITYIYVQCEALCCRHAEWNPAAESESESPSSLTPIWARGWSGVDGVLRLCAAPIPRRPLAPRRRTLLLLGGGISLSSFCILSAEPQLLSWSLSSDRRSSRSRADLGKYAEDLVAPTPRKLLNASVVFFTLTLSEPMRRNPSFSANDAL